jgi:hypothetical protein
MQVYCTGSVPTGSRTKWMSAHSKYAKADQLLQLSGEVSRIAGALARLSTETVPVFKTPVGIPDISAAQVMAVIRARRQRDRCFPAGIFADPAWDMMLTLLHAELSHARVSVANLSSGAAVPATTALRWINSMVEKGLFVREADPHDGRRVFVELAPKTSTALRRYFSEYGAMPGV